VHLVKHGHFHQGHHMTKMEDWRSHHWICHTRKTHATCRSHGAIFYRTWVMGDRSLHRGNRSIGPVLLLLILTRWPLYTNLTRIAWR